MEKSAWWFNSGESFCRITTTVQPDVSPDHVFLSLYYTYQPVLTDNCKESLEQNVISAKIFPKRSENIQVGTHALLQSNSLLNEQVPILQFSQNCRKRRTYSLDYRVTDLLLTALLAKENVRLTVYLEKSGEMTGPVHTNGFEVAYEKLVSCIERLNEKTDM